MRRHVPARHHIVIQNCVVSGRWDGLAVGSEMSGGAYDIFTEDCRINSPDFHGRYNPRNPVFLRTNKKRGGAMGGVYVRRSQGRQIDRDCIHLTTRTRTRPATTQQSSATSAWSTWSMTAPVTPPASRD
ncbi:hypothetical protein ACFCZY_21805 [Streptomyces sp. NPDC056237]|uniref:hypothetical protein n=1 Tax=Streptomyces sp. NPDC056237 TaxID=3345758 RepID=UPI0035E3A2F3